MFLYTMRNPDTIYGLLGLSVAADLTQEVWKGLDKETKREVRKTGIYHLKSAYDDMPYEISLDLIQDGAKYTILDMPGTVKMTVLVKTWCIDRELIGYALLCIVVVALASGD